MSCCSCGARGLLSFGLVFLSFCGLGALAERRATSPKKRQEKTDKPNGRREREDKSRSWVCFLFLELVVFSLMKWNGMKKNKQWKREEQTNSPHQAAKRCAASQGKRKAIPSNAAELWALRLIGFALFLRRVGWLDWACFSLWVNGAGTAQCSAKKEASQAKQSNQLLSLFFFRKLNSWNLWVMSAERHLRRKTFHSAASSTAPLHSFFGFHLSLLKKRRAAEGNQ